MRRSPRSPSGAGEKNRSGRVLALPEEVAEGVAVAGQAHGLRGVDVDDRRVGRARDVAEGVEPERGAGGRRAPGLSVLATAACGRADLRGDEGPHQGRGHRDREERADRQRARSHRVSILRGGVIPCRLSTPWSPCPFPWGPRKPLSIARNSNPCAVFRIANRLSSCGFCRTLRVSRVKSCVRGVLREDGNDKGLTETERIPKTDPDNGPQTTQGVLGGGAPLEHERKPLRDPPSNELEEPGGSNEQTETDNRQQTTN